VLRRSGKGYRRRALSRFPKNRPYHVRMASDERAPDPRPARTRAAIYAAARELSAADGEVTVNALAKRAGVSRAAFYSHFGGLDDLIGAMVHELLDGIREETVALFHQGRSVHEIVQYSAAATSAYVVEHHAFLRGAIDWKFTQRPYMGLVRIYAELFEYAFQALGDAVPSYLPQREMSRFLAGGYIHVIAAWLLDTEEKALAGEELDPRELLTILLRVLPPWYTGVGPDDPIPEVPVHVDGEPGPTAAPTA